MPVVSVSQMRSHICPNQHRTRRNDGTIRDRVFCAFVAWNNTKIKNIYIWWQIMKWWEIKSGLTCSSSRTSVVLCDLHCLWLHRDNASKRLTSTHSLVLLLDPAEQLRAGVFQGSHGMVPHLIRINTNNSVLTDRVYIKCIQKQHPCFMPQRGLHHRCIRRTRCKDGVCSIQWEPLAWSIYAKKVF